jgi:hypothetical protein
MAITQEQLDNWFVYHSPEGDQNVRYDTIRVAAKSLAALIVKFTPESADQTASIRKLRECVMTANAAIACGGK